ncbi:phytanoyl-CoA dioxygenase family protein [Achromobacter pestifer]|uniref:phytanoyl-CoA dioxygenase family protein n=1 Tax=Achromobacter pestifer TaxID=1353889 RepID=UPI001FE4FD39|nr:phytanoyl-CoA dioxygenase family protein [Achromobacter pestifer]
MLRWFLVPIWLLALATGAKSFKDNPIIGSSFLNKKGLYVARVKLAHRMAHFRRRRLAHLISHQDRENFDRNGFVLKRDFLAPSMFAAIEREVSFLQGDSREMMQGDTRTRRVSLDVDTLRVMPATRALLYGEQWLGLLSYASSFRCHPMNYLQTIMTHIGGRASPDPQTNLHSDTFHPTVKAWLFLSDVTLSDSAFVYVPGSHRINRRRLAWLRRQSMQVHSLDRLSARGSLRVSESKARSMGYEKPRVFSVRKNTLVVADTSGFHARGQTSHPATRIEIWGYGRRNPFLPWAGWGVQGLPGLKGRVVPLYWCIRDLAEALGMRRNPWRRVSTKKIKDE